MLPLRFLLIIAAGILQSAFAISQPVKLNTQSLTLQGTLELPTSSNRVPVVLMLADAGVVDRDGNGLRSEGRDGIKQLALALSQNKIASLRYDKRSIDQNQHDPTIVELVSDARAWIEFLKNDPRFSSTIVLGHGEGSLVGMMAARGLKLAAFVSVCGFGRPAQLALLEEIERSRPADAFVDSSLIVQELEAGRKVTDMEPGLWRYFRPNTQDYLMSLFALDPALELAKLELPVLIVRGENDARVSPPETEQLLVASPKAKVLKIATMRHDLTDSSGGLAPGLLEGLLKFFAI